MSSALLTQHPLQTSLLRANVRPLRCPHGPRLTAHRERKHLQCNAGNLLVEILASSVGAASVVAITTFTSENKMKEIDRLQTFDGLLPVGAALAADALVHSIPVLGGLVTLITEPAGAAAGVAYLFTLVLSSKKVDPKTLAPAGTVLNAKKADDVRAAVRVPFTQIIPTTLSVIDSTNDSSSGAGWDADAKGLPKLPITSVAAVLGIGAIIVELLAHAPVLSLVLPRALTYAAWFAAIGVVLDKRAEEQATR